MNCLSMAAQGTKDTRRRSPFAHYVFFVAMKQKSFEVRSRQREA